MTTHSSFVVGGAAAERRGSASPHVRFVFFAMGMALALFLAIVVCLEIGRQLGIAQAARIGESSRSGIGVIDGVVFAVFSLLLGFTFHGATTRFDRRRDLVAGEVGSVAMAWARLDALPADSQRGIRTAFRRYLDAVLESYSDVKRVGSAESEQQHLAIVRAQNETWQLSLATCLTEQGEKARMLVLPALNEMFHSVEKERLARRMHPPAVIWVMLGIAALTSSTFAGYNMSSAPTRNWIYILGMAATVSIVMYVIIELEYPRLGLIRVDAFDQALVDLRATMG
jgi:fumarate reductase subunit D